MPNRETHLTGGLLAAWVPVVVYFLVCNERPPFLQEGGDFGWIFAILLISLLGMVGGVLPDMLEPPTDPRHRGPFHYLGGGLCVVFMGVILIVDTSILETFSDLASWAVISLIAGYASHIILDVLPVE